MTGIRQILVLFVVFISSMTLFSASSMAFISAAVTCTPTGGVAANPQFFDIDDVVNVANNDCSKIDSRMIFSSIVCNFVTITNEVFSKFYCALQYAMTSILMAVVTLYIAVFGMKMLMGTQELTSGSAILGVVKIGALFMFASDGAMGIGLIYNFFIDLVVETVDWVLSAINFCSPSCLNSTGLREIFASIDNNIYAFIMGVDDGTGNLKDGLFSDNAELIMFLLVLMILIPPLFQMVVYLLWMTFMVFARTMVSFMMSIIAIAFLIALSPIFLSFMLFGPTFRMFMSWVSFLISYSIQPVLIFAMFATWITVAGDFLQFVDQLSKVMMVEKTNRDKGAISTNEDGIMFCRPKYDTKTIGVTFTPFPKVTHAGPIIELNSTTVSGNTVTSGGCCALNLNTIPEVTCNNSAPSLNIDDPSIKDHLVEPSVMARDNQFIYFLAYHIITILIVSYAFFNMIKIAPELAQQLSRSQVIAPLGMGFGGGVSGFNQLVGSATSLGRSIGAKAGGAAARRITPRVNDFTKRFSSTMSGRR